MDMPFELLKEHDKGAFGTIWEATDHTLGRRVAVKVILPDMVEEGSALAHAKALTKFDHPNIVKVFQVAKVLDPKTQSVTDGIVMEWIEGKSLGDRLNGPAFKEDEAAAICVAVADAITHMHAKGLVHGDLHPGNVLVGSTFTKIIDVKHYESTSFSAWSSKRRETFIKADIDSLCFVIRRVLMHSKASMETVAPIEAALRSVTSLDQIVLATAELRFLAIGHLQSQSGGVRLGMATESAPSNSSTIEQVAKPSVIPSSEIERSAKSWLEMAYQVSISEGDDWTDYVLIARTGEQIGCDILDLQQSTEYGELRRTIESALIVASGQLELRGFGRSFVIAALASKTAIQQAWKQLERERFERNERVVLIFGRVDADSATYQFVPELFA